MEMTLFTILLLDWPSALVGIVGKRKQHTKHPSVGYYSYGGGQVRGGSEGSYGAGGLWVDWGG